MIIIAHWRTDETQNIISYITDIEWDKFNIDILIDIYPITTYIHKIIRTIYIAIWLIYDSYINI